MNTPGRAPTIDTLRRKWRGMLSRFEQRPVIIPAILGNALGVVEVNPEIPGLVHFTDARGKPGVAVNNRVTPIAGTAVLIEQTRPGVFRVKETRETGAGNAPGVLDPTQMTAQTPNVAQHPIFSPSHSDVDWEAELEPGDTLVWDGTLWVPGAVAPVYPFHATMFHDESKIVAGTATFYGPRANSQSGTVVGSSAIIPSYSVQSIQDFVADGNAFEQGFMLASGTYRFSAFGTPGPDKGILDWAIDGTDVVTGQDYYNSDASISRVLKIATGIVVTGSGNHVLRGTTNGKNGASSNYFISLIKYWLERE